MDTARCYRLSDPTKNRQFHRRWCEPPPLPAPPVAELAFACLADALACKARIGGGTA